MGIQLEDVITSVDGKPIQNPSDLQEAVKEHPEGAALTVTVFRNGEMVNLTMAATKSTKPS